MIGFSLLFHNLLLLIQLGPTLSSSDQENALQVYNNRKSHLLDH